ncbi:MAG TPA: acylglycerol kinase family protein, partial [Pyrinomonadaceae bacterium]|nr:acylglycerol kinase family protein [Pyrinomonadaceae bacterium]
MGAHLDAARRCARRHARRLQVFRLNASSWLHRQIMRVTLIHNPKAGKGHPTGDELQTLIKEAGHKVLYQSAKEKKWQRALQTSADLIVVAGGDGTIRKVATRLAGSRVPLTILPLGTANNIAKSLGINGSFEQLVAGWAG